MAISEMEGNPEQLQTHSFSPELSLSSAGWQEPETVHEVKPSDPLRLSGT